MATVPTQLPTRIRAGDTLKFTLSLADYPASEGWTLSHSFRQPADSAKTFQFSATASGSSYAITVPADTTAGWVAGDYIGQATVNLNGEVYTVWEGTVTVIPSIASAEGEDLRSTARRALDNVMAVIENRASKEILESDIDGVKLSKIPVDQLWIMRDRLQLIVNNEDAAARRAAGKGAGRKILTRFNRPSSPGQSFPWR